MTKTLIDAYNYFENHKEYGYEDIPEEDITNIINLHNAIVGAMNQLTKDGRIVPADYGYPTHEGKGSIKNNVTATLSHVLIYRVHHQYGRVEFLDRNDSIIQIMDIDDLTRISVDFYSEMVEYEELLPTDNPYRDEIVSCIKFVNRTKEELLRIKS